MAGARDELFGKLELVEDLPTFPAILIELERVLADEYSGAAEAAVIIEEDPAITANVLRLANSAALHIATSGTIVTCQQGIARIGFNNLRELVQTAAVIKAFAGTGSSYVDHKKFWARSLGCAVAARTLRLCSKSPDLCDDDELYTAGLLADIGMLILDQHFQEQAREAQALADKSGSTLAEAEVSVLGADHGEVGGYLLAQWDLPEAIVQIVACHHRPEKAEAEFLVPIRFLQLAERVVDHLATCSGDDEQLPELPEQALEDLAITPAVMLGAVDEIRKSSASMISCIL